MRQYPLFYVIKTMREKINEFLDYNNTINC